MTTKKYNVGLTDGNAFSIMTYVSSAMIREGFPEADIKKYLKEAQSKNYSNLVKVSKKWINRCNAHAALGVR